MRPPISSETLADMFLVYTLEAIPSIATVSRAVEIFQVLRQLVPLENNEYGRCIRRQMLSFIEMAHETPHEKLRAVQVLFPGMTMEALDRELWLVTEPEHCAYLPKTGVE